MTKPNITIREFEAKVLEIEEIVVVVRAPASTMVPDYDYTRKAAGSSSVTDYVDGRLRQSLGSTEFTIINGDHTSPHGRTKMSTLRESYEK